MQQQVNLFLSFPKPPRYNFTIEFAGQIIGSIIVILFLATLQQQWTLSSLRNDLRVLQSKLNTAKKALEEVKATYPQAIEQNQMQAQIDDLAQQIAAKKAMNSKNIFGESRAGFSTYMESFAKTIAPGAWITSFSLANDGENTRIAGNASSPAAVVHFLQSLSQQPGFIGRDFKTIKLTEPLKPADFISFILSTTEEQGVEAK